MARSYGASAIESRYRRREGRRPPRGPLRSGRTGPSGPGFPACAVRCSGEMDTRAAVAETHVSVVTFTYRAMLERARTALELGEPAVLDASWRHEAWRELARGVAAETASELTELWCQAPGEVAAARLQARTGVRDLSDATEGTLAAMADDFDAWLHAIAVDTSAEACDSVAQALEALDCAGAGALP